MKRIIPIIIAIAVVILAYFYLQERNKAEQLEIGNDILKYKLQRCEKNLKMFQTKKAPVLHQLQEDFDTIAK